MEGVILLKLYSVLCSRLFLIGAILKLVALFSIEPNIVSAWYIPFLKSSAFSWSLDPWKHWLQQGGSQLAFPYGWSMWLVFMPLVTLFKGMGWPLTIAYGLTLFFVDAGIFILLRTRLLERDQFLISAYWLSPIVFMATYVLGYNDLVPLFFLCFSLYWLRQTRVFWAGFVLMTAISAKLSMIISLPFFIIYFIHQPTLRSHLKYFIKGLSLGFLTFFIPFLCSTSGIFMLFNNPEVARIYHVGLNLAGGIQLYLIPMVYCFMLYLTWRIKRLNFDLFNILLGIAFILIVILTLSSPGWFVWLVPFLVVYQAMSDRIAAMLVALFSSLYVGYAFFRQADLIEKVAQYWGLENVFNNGHYVLSLISTMLVCVGLILIWRMGREAVHRNDFFRLSRRPFLIGIAGDSGSGKDTLAEAVKGLFGHHSVVCVSGDDYHLWDRHRPMWQAMTHLNPMANDLERFAHDVVSLLDQKSIQARHYNHETGRMSRTFRVKSNDFILVSGLHALYLPILRQCYNLSVYLDIDEGLRRYFKIKRDVHQRGHALEKVLGSLDKRQADSDRFIKPQSEHADLVFSLQPMHPDMVWSIALDEKTPIRYKLQASSSHGLQEPALRRVLIGMCGMHVDMEVNNDGSKMMLTMEGEVSAQDIALAAKMICPRVFDFLDIAPLWHDGPLGLMQLITLSHIHQALTKRFI
jgi:uridine kinase